MRLVESFEMRFVQGANGGNVPPTCTTTTLPNGDSSTTCSCPTGTTLTVGTSGGKTVVTCKKSD